MNFEQLGLWVNEPRIATQGAPEKGHGTREALGEFRDSNFMAMEFVPIAGTEDRDASFQKILSALGDAEDMVMPKIDHEVLAVGSIPRGMLMEAGSGDDAGADGEHDGASVMDNREGQRASKE